ncbi:MAG: DEAD/DEAH box helicase family protein [Gammaproteobacteria bacterium]|nr:DEAD/DEAH box helicase family protein [Gammaproteobacteria bacterium]
MELKEYQVRVLERFDAYLAELKRGKQKLDKVRAINAQEPDVSLHLPLPDAGKEAWDALQQKGALPASRAAQPYSARSTGAGEPLPNLCLKIPTGGGKTLLATECAARVVNAYLQRNHGLVLWIVPNEAIYAQTQKALRDRDHPFRQRLDRAGAGRVKILEKDDPLTRADVDEHLCVMLLMLASANRETKESLRLFKDRGNVHGFFPPEGDWVAHQALLARVPNLDVYGIAANYGAEVKHSLGNVMRLVRPVVIMDEGHKAYSALAQRTLEGFNPSFLLELSATPPAESNWLVDVRGTDLDREGMVKMPIRVETNPGHDWRSCLSKAVERLNSLQAEAEKLLANANRYIRPILLVQVERTGKDQRDGQHVHALDAKEYLETLGFDAKDIAIKTAERNDLSQPENLNLLSPVNRVRVIITKQALQEGWDCPFAYVLCSLAAQTAEGAMTQLVGRILRQPHATKTGVAALDESYVLALHASTRDVVEAISKGLKEDGLGDLAGYVQASGSGTGANGGKRRVSRRDSFQKLDIYLPQVNWVADAEPRLLDYEADLLQWLDWRVVDIEALAAKLSPEVQAVTGQRVTVHLGRGERFIETEEQEAVAVAGRFDTVFATRAITDIVSNAWLGYVLVEKLLGALRARGWAQQQIDGRAGYLLDELRRYLTSERDRLAELRFKQEVLAGRIRFQLRADARNWQMPRELATAHAANAAQLTRPDGRPTEKSIFAPMYSADFNPDEAAFACYLDSEQTLNWWHRNVARVGYGLQGWRRHKVYPDFLFALSGTGKRRKLLAWETKGEQLEGNLDTHYKRELLRYLTEAGRRNDGVRAGELRLVDEGAEFECELIMLADCKSKLARRLRATSGGPGAEVPADLAGPDRTGRGAVADGNP